MRIKDIKKVGYETAPKIYLLFHVEKNQYLNQFVTENGRTRRSLFRSEDAAKKRADKLMTEFGGTIEVVGVYED